MKQKNQRKAEMYIQVLNNIWNNIMTNSDEIKEDVVDSEVLKTLIELGYLRALLTHGIIVDDLNKEDLKKLKKMVKVLRMYNKTLL